MFMLTSKNSSQCKCHVSAWVDGLKKAMHYMC